MSLKHLPQLELFNSPLVNKALNKLTGSRLKESGLKNEPAKAESTEKSAKSKIILPAPEINHTSGLSFLKTKPPSSVKDNSSNSEKIYQNLVTGLKDFFNATGFKKAIIGLSGGIDSTVTFKIAIDALGADNISALIMPELGTTKPESIKHARGLAEYFGTKIFYQPINPFILDFRSLSWKPSPLAEMNTKARIRMTILYNYANTISALVLGTSNKSELLLGYGTKYGDLAADVEVIAELYKTDVYSIGRYLDLPHEILAKAPSAELAPGQTDEAELGASYEILDEILKALAKGETENIQEKFDPALIEKIATRIQTNKHKTVMPPTIPI